MKFTIPKIKKLIKESLIMGDIGHPLLDKEYDYYTDLVGHTNPYYRLFYLLAKELKPNFVVELGSYRATASGHFAVGHPQSIVATIDIHKDMPQQGPDQNACVIAAQTIPNLFYINKWTVDFMGGECGVKDIVAYNKPIDILFIDAWHDEKHVKREVELYFPLLADNALVICDDLADGAYGPFVGMEDWWKSLPGQKFISTDIHAGIQMGFLKYVRK